jgi:hypothetical protein
MTKLSISQAWDETRTVLARDGKLIASVALALLVLPGVLVSLFLPTPTGDEVPVAGLWIPIVVVALAISFMGQLSIVRLAMAPHVTVADAIKHAARRTPHFIAAFLLWIMPFVIVAALFYAILRANPSRPSPIAGLGLLIVTILGIFIFVRMFLIGPIATAEQIGPIGILRRSWALTAGNWWRLFGFFVVFAVGTVVLVRAAASILGLLATMTFEVPRPVNVSFLIVIILVQALSAAMYVILFVMQARLYNQRRASAAHPSVPTTGI